PAALAPGHLPLGVLPLVTEAFSPCTPVACNRDLLSVLTCTLTAGPEPAARAAPETTRAKRSAPTRAATDLRFMRATPFHEGCWLCGRRLVSWLSGLPPAPSRRLDVASGCLRTASPITVAG